MRRKRRKPIYFEASSLYDGTVLAAYPVRKPTAKMQKQGSFRLDADNIGSEFVGAGGELSRIEHDNRFRFQDIIANRLNVRRALRDLVLPRIESLEERLAGIESGLNRLEQILKAASRNTDE